MGPGQLNLEFDKEGKMLDPSQYGWQSWQVQVSWKIPIPSSIQGSWSGFCSGSQVEDRCQDEIFSRLSEKSLGSENASLHKLIVSVKLDQLTDSTRQKSRRAVIATAV